MCLIAFAWLAHPRWRLVLAGNRDEFHARPTEALARWSDAPIIGGRDLEAGGTWLGVTASGRCAAVTNVREPDAARDGASRGLLVTDYLQGQADAAVHAASMCPRAGDYHPFNLLTFDARAAFYRGNRPQPRVQRISDGVHGLSNAGLNTPWPKTRVLMQRLQTWIDIGQATFAPLFDALADEQVAADDELPDTGIGLARERALSPAFIRGESYGTRASTVVAIAHDGAGIIMERRFGPGGRFDGGEERIFNLGA